MKKFIILLFISICFLTGCTKNNNNIKINDSNISVTDDDNIISNENDFK